jgi:extracellular elastinolytic metalloproteinase
MLHSRQAVAVCVGGVFLAAAFTVAAQERGPKADRGYRKPTVTRGSPASPLTPPAAGRAVDRAMRYVKQHPGEWGLTPADVEDVVVTGESRSAHTGLSHVFVRQRVDGIEVFGADANFNIGPDGRVLSAGSSFFSDVAPTVNRGSPMIAAVEAVEAAATHVGLEIGEPLEVIEARGGREQETVLTDGGIASGPIAVKLVYQPVGPRELRLAWQVDLEETSRPHLWRMTVDAETGEVLNEEDYTSHDNWDAPTLFSGDPSIAGRASSLLTRPRVEAGARAGVDGGATAAVSGSPTPVNDGSAYRVYALPLESPNDGPRTLVTNPADAIASPYGWHDTDGSPGAEFTITRGNNTHAYLDRTNNNQPDPGQDADGGPSLFFDFPIDLALQPQTYGAAAVTNLFYWCNVVHDVFYRYGFTEPSGNFQANNYGRGGIGGDYVRCEAQDGGGVNNANFSTPAADGGAPRMQMYLWNPAGGLQPNFVTVDPPSTAAGNYPASGAAFGPLPTPTGMAGPIVVVNDGTALPAEGCSPLVGFPAGAIALTDRGTCPFVQKVNNAQAAGAVAVIVANNAAGAPITMGGADPAIVIPSVMVSLANGTTIKAGLPATGNVRNNPAAVQRDGDLENGIIIHEYTHGLSLRLTGGPGINCLSGNEQAGEGWSDWYALAMLLDPALDDPQGPRGMGPYAIFQDSRQGGGIRPRPYSRDMQIQPFTYDSIKTGAWLNGASLALPHGLGHGWAAVLWDMTWDLVEKHGFNPDVYAAWNTGGNNRALQYVTDGLKLQGCAPTLVRARDAILEATQLVGNGTDTCTAWAAFARRGLGYSASGGTTNRNDNTEAFDTHPSCRAGFQAPFSAPYGQLNVRGAGSTVPLRFQLARGLGGNVLASHSPFSRKVDCDTLTVPSIGEFITPREYPEAATPPGKSGLSWNAQGVYHYNWQTSAEWAGTCRELVLTRTDGVQHRAFFRFVSSETDD